MKIDLRKFIAKGLLPFDTSRHMCVCGCHTSEVLQIKQIQCCKCIVCKYCEKRIRSDIAIRHTFMCRINELYQLLKRKHKNKKPPSS